MIRGESKGDCSPLPSIWRGPPMQDAVQEVSEIPFLLLEHFGEW